MRTALAGIRIREQRKKLGLKQADLAKSAGISASYLNLIEHNRRPVSGKVLNGISRALGLSTSEISEGADTELAESLRDVLAGHPSQSESQAGVEEFIGRFPDWARIIALQARQIKSNEAALATYSDRQNFDPHLQNTLHEMLTTITAIRSTSGILTTEEDIDTSQQSRFQTVIHDESRRLSDAAQSLVAYFDKAHETTLTGAASHEAFETFLERRDHVFHELENPKDPNKAIGRILKAELGTAPEDARNRARARMVQYAKDAKALPIDEFLETARSLSFAPDQIAAKTGTTLHTVFRRLASLAREGLDVPHFGLVIINAAGQPKFRRPLAEFSLPRFSTICALWPAFQALSVPNQPIRECISLPNGREFLAHAIALGDGHYNFGQAPIYTSAMLVTSLNEAFNFGMLTHVSPTLREVGTTCRLCQTKDCPARSEPSILPD